MEENEGVESEDDSESDTEGESEVAKDFCTHQQLCPSVEECIVYRMRLNEENGRLKTKLKKLRSEQKTLMEKRRALSILRQTINVESKIARLEQVLTWMYEARDKMSSGATAEDGQAQKDGQQEQQPSVAAGSSKDMGC